jgi:hypothetical protein
MLATREPRRLLRLSSRIALPLCLITALPVFAQLNSPAASVTLVDSLLNFKGFFSFEGAGIFSL